MKNLFIIMMLLYASFLSGQIRNIVELVLILLKSCFLKQY